MCSVSKGQSMEPKLHGKQQENTGHSRQAGKGNRPQAATGKAWHLPSFFKALPAGAVAELLAMKFN